MNANKGRRRFNPGRWARLLMEGVGWGGTKGNLKGWGEATSHLRSLFEHFVWQDVLKVSLPTAGASLIAIWKWVTVGITWLVPAILFTGVLVTTGLILRTAREIAERPVLESQTTLTESRPPASGIIIRELSKFNCTIEIENLGGPCSLLAIARVIALEGSGVSHAGERKMSGAYVLAIKDRSGLLKDHVEMTYKETASIRLAVSKGGLYEAIGLLAYNSSEDRTDDSEILEIQFSHDRPARVTLEVEIYSRSGKPYSNDLEAFAICTIEKASPRSISLSLDSFWPAKSEEV